MRHTSGITDCQDLLEAEGIGVTDPAGQKEAIGAVLASQPEEPPGTRFSYSYSNYVLLAQVVEKVTGKPFPAFVQQEFFTQLGLRMTLPPAVDVPGKAKSYDEKDGSYAPNSSPWTQYGDGAVQTTPGELVRWADNYRTGRIGGKQLLAGLTDGAVSVGDTLRGRGIEEGRYGAGMLILPDKSLVHRGGRGSTAPSRSARTAAPPSPSCATWIRPITSVRRTGCWTSGPDDARRGSRCGRAPETGPGA
ncbi:serine hydrolase domain-containing protein [Streptomyces xanthophaeus]